MIQWHFAKRSIFMGKVAWNSYLTHGLRHNCVIDQSATENKVIHTLIIDFFSHGLRSVKIEQELEKLFLQRVGLYVSFLPLANARGKTSLHKGLPMVKTIYAYGFHELFLNLSMTDYVIDRRGLCFISGCSMTLPCKRYTMISMQYTK